VMCRGFVTDVADTFEIVTFIKSLRTM